MTELLIERALSLGECVIIVRRCGGRCHPALIARGNRGVVRTVIKREKQKQSELRRVS